MESSASDADSTGWIGPTSGAKKLTPQQQSDVGAPNSATKTEPAAAGGGLQQTHQPPGAVTARSGRGAWDNNRSNDSEQALYLPTSAAVAESRSQPHDATCTGAFPYNR